MAYRGVALADADARRRSRAEWRPIVEELAAEPRVLCHRDYHSRNLMLHDGSCTSSTSRTRGMGPDTYDLVSLLRDSYVDLAERRSSTSCIAYFLALTGAASAGADATREFRRRFDLMALQRNLKALGTFGYQTTARGNPVYIQYIPRTLRLRARRTSQTLPAASRRLRELLAPQSTIERARADAAQTDRLERRPGRIRLQWVFRSSESMPCSSASRRTLSTTSGSSREHLVEIAAHGFDAVEVVRDAHALRLPRRRRPSTSSRQWLREAGLRAALDPRADRRAASRRRRWGAAVLERRRATSATRERAVGEARRRAGAGRRVPVSVLVVHLGLAATR